jgi:hypothetical protein
MKHLEGEDTFFIFNQKNSKNVYFLLQNRHLKPKTDCKKIENGYFKHVFLGTMILHLQTYSKCSRNAMQNLIKPVRAIRCWTKEVKN